MAPSMLSLTLLSLVCLATAQNYCYTAKDMRAGSAIVPCGNSGISSCCQLGDLCLSDSACWNPTYNVTYLYGCTDPTYTSTVCPYKCGEEFANAPYVGLDYCSNTTNNEWSCTHPPNNSKAIEPFAQQDCYADSIVALAGPSSLQPILSLPTAYGESTVYFSEVNPTFFSLVPGYTPSFIDVVAPSIPTNTERVSDTSSFSPTTTPPTSSTLAPSTSTSFMSTPTKMSLTATSNSLTGTQTNTGTPTARPSSASKGLSKGTVAGIGVAIALVVCVLAFIVFCVLWRRKRRSYAYAKDSARDSDSQESGRYAIASYLKEELKRESGGLVPKAELEGSYRHTRDLSGSTTFSTMSEINGVHGLNTPSTTQRWSIPSPAYPSYAGLSEAGSDTIWEATGDHGAYELPGDIPTTATVTTKADTEGREVPQARTSIQEETIFEEIIDTESTEKNEKS